MNETRIESDSIGEIEVPAAAYWGAQTERSRHNFAFPPHERMPLPIVHALARIKGAAARVNRNHGLDAGLADAIAAAADAVAAGEYDDQFPLAIWQTGSGTQSNMNENDVIAGIANEKLAGTRGGKAPVHPNDHVNMGQSTNCTFPTAIHVAVALAVSKDLIPALKRLHDVLADKAKQWDKVIKIGRTHLADATPLRLGQEVGGFARQIELSIQRAERAVASLMELPVGGTAVGTGINTHPEFAKRTCAALAKETGLPFVEAVNHFEANAQRDALVECHGQLRAVAVTLFNVSNNIRWLGSGPRCGFYEIQLPDRQPGSSIMPGKVNPVMCESMMQVTAKVMGNDQTIAISGAAGGQFQLNIMMPVMGDTTLESVSLLTGCTNAFVDFCALEMEANVEQCEASVEKSLSMCTSLNPYIGYEKAAALAKQAFKTGKTIRELCEEQNILPADQLKKALDPWSMTEPG